MPHLQRHNTTFPTIIVSNASGKLRREQYAGSNKFWRIIERRRAGRQANPAVSHDRRSSISVGFEDTNLTLSRECSESCFIDQQHLQFSSHHQHAACFCSHMSMANSIITRRTVFGTALDSAASIHRNRTLQVNAGRQHLVQACIHSTPSACDAH